MLIPSKGIASNGSAVYHITGNFGGGFNLVIGDFRVNRQTKDCQILVQCTCAKCYAYKSANIKFTNSTFWLFRQNVTTPKFADIPYIYIYTRWTTLLMDPASNESSFPVACLYNRDSRLGAKKSQSQQRVHTRKSDHVTVWVRDWCQLLTMAVMGSCDSQHALPALTPLALQHYGWSSWGHPFTTSEWRWCV